MLAVRPTIVITLAFLALIAGSTADAYQVYYWLDENGVPNFSQMRPDGEIPEINKLKLEDTTPADFDPDEDRYGVQAQAKRLETLRKEMGQRRESARKHRRTAPRQQQVVQHREPARRYWRGFRYRPVHSRPPHNPKPVPYSSSTLKLSQ